MNEGEVETNIVFFRVMPDAKVNAEQLVTQLKQDKGILVGGTITQMVIGYHANHYCSRLGGYWNGEKVRAVTNLHVNQDDVQQVITAIRELVV